mgnify:CR=1 FL=1
MPLEGGRLEEVPGVWPDDPPLWVLLWVVRGEEMTKAKQIENILANFDFGRVQAHMRKVGWTWGSEKQVPTLPELQATAQKLLEDLIPKMTYFSTGGFYATWDKDKTRRLWFAVETAGSLPEGER